MYISRPQIYNLYLVYLCCSTSLVHGFARFALGHRALRGPLNIQQESTALGTVGRMEIVGSVAPLITLSSYLESGTYNVNEEEHSLTKLQNTKIGVALGARLPLGILAPYARLGWMIYGFYSGSGYRLVDGVREGKNYNYNAWGPTASIGIELNPLPIFGVFIQLDAGQEYIRAANFHLIKEEPYPDGRIYFYSSQISLGFDLSLPFL
ncbi:MAG: hypothetical protein OXT67_13570 [Zetaproteobacteria bacterium]|nr:hypothetical protein [Zetaproteobacteria bacterium]